MKFTYTVKDINGKTKADVVEAVDQEHLIQELQKQGYFIVNITEFKASEILQKAAKSKQRRFTHSGIKLDDLIVFAHQLTTMLEAGVNLLRSLDVITSQVESQQLYKVLNAVKADVEQGNSFSSALEKHPRVFDQLWVSLVEVGEASGTMPVILQKLAYYLEQQASFKATVTSAIIYPAILSVVAMGAVAFFALVIGPRFESIFSTMGVQLPMITKILLAIFNFIRHKFLLILLGMVGFVFILRLYNRTVSGRLQFEKIIFGLPKVGVIFKLVVIERFSSQMAMLIDSGVPILYALDITQRLVNNETCARIVGDIKEGVRQGKLLVDPMQKSGFFPPMAIQMIFVGEETGELSRMLKHVATFYQNTVETFTKRLGTVLEPIMLVFMGGIIGTIVVAMFLPMFNITKLGGGR